MPPPPSTPSPLALMSVLAWTSPRAVPVKSPPPAAAADVVQGLEAQEPAGLVGHVAADAAGTGTDREHLPLLDDVDLGQNVGEATVALGRAAGEVDDLVQTDAGAGAEVDLAARAAALGDAAGALREHLAADGDGARRDDDRCRRSCRPRVPRASSGAVVDSDPSALTSMLPPSMPPEASTGPEMTIGPFVPTMSSPPEPASPPLTFETSAERDVAAGVQVDEPAVGVGGGAVGADLAVDDDVPAGRELDGAAAQGRREPRCASASPAPPSP